LMEARWKVAVLHLCLLGAMASLAPGARALPVSGQLLPRTSLPSDSESLRSEFSFFWRDLASLREAELSARADELWSTEPRLTLRAMILRLGREIPATVTSARRSERLALRASAADWLVARLEAGGEGRSLWEEEVNARLADTGRVVLWCATARTVGRLGLFEYAPVLAVQLESPVPQLAHSARLALFDLFLRWFEDRAAFATFWAEAAPSCQQSLFMETARAMEREARETLVQLLEYEPQRAEALLEHPDPRLRAAAAAALGRATNGETTAAVETLLVHLESEHDGLALQAAIDALLQPLGALPVDSPELIRMRAILARRLGEGDADLQAPLADALRRLKWSEQPTGEASLLAGLRLVVEQIRDLSDPDALTDRDVLVTVLAAVESLAERSREATLAVEAELAPLTSLVLGTIEDSRESDVVRIAASKLLPLVAGAEGLGRAAAALDAPHTSPTLRYNLLASLGDLAASLPPDDPGAELVLITLLTHLGGDDANLRRRALSYLRAEELRELVGTADPSAFVTCLGLESVPELQAQLLELISTFGGPAQVDELIALPNFDAIVGGGPASVARLEQTIEDLGAGDGARLVRGARRLLAAGDESSRVLRLREALVLVAAISDDSLAGLSPDEHKAIVSWATEMREAAGVVPGGRAFLARLGQSHLPGCAGEAESTAQLEHVRALFLSDLIDLDPAAGGPPEVLGLFGEALTSAASSGDELRRALVLRDRARFNAKVGRTTAALNDYRSLFESELPVLPVEAGGPSGNGAPRRHGVLELSDLRLGGGLLADARLEDPAAPARAAEALRVSLLLVQDPIWKLEPAPVRAQDLDELVERAVRSGDVEALSGVSELFDELPPLPELSGDAPEDSEESLPEPPDVPEDALWAGLLDTREEHAALIALRDRLGGARDELREASEESIEEVDESSEEPPADDLSDEEAAAEEPALEEDPPEKPTPSSVGPDTGLIGVSEGAEEVPSGKKPPKGG
jgi:hypothetical protein